MQITLYVTSCCTRHCKECIMQHFMENNKNYQMSLNEIKEFIDICTQSNYAFDIIFSGGEPLLWHNLKEGTSLLRSSSICKRIDVFSNALDISRVDKEFIDNIDALRISRYEENEKNIQILSQQYKSKIQVVDRKNFWVNPRIPVLETLPPHCLNSECLLMNHKIYACPHSASIALGAGITTTGLYTPIQKNFINEINKIRKYQSDIVCNRCISNNKVRIKVEKERNY